MDALRMPTKIEAEVLAFLAREEDEACAIGHTEEMSGYEAREEEIDAAARACEAEGWLTYSRSEAGDDGWFGTTEPGRAALWRARRAGVLPPRIYVSGAMTGQPDHGRPAFAAATEQLRAAGYEVVNPAEHQGPVEGKEWHEYLRADLKLLVECDGVALLPGWRASRGACLEDRVARALGMRSWIIERWLEDAAVTRVPVTVCPCGCTWKDPSGASAALMALAVNCRHPRQRALQGGGAFCPDCNHWQFTQAELAASKVRMPRPMYRVVEEDERVG